MSITSPQSVSILPSGQSSGGAITEWANSLRYGRVDFTDQKQQAALASALGSIQDQVNNILRALRSPLPQADPIQITNANGQLIAQLGHILGPDNRIHFGIWVADGYFYLGGTGPGDPNGSTLNLPRPGWASPTGTVSRGTFDQSTVTLPQLAQRLAALIEDLLSARILAP